MPDTTEATPEPAEPAEPESPVEAPSLAPRETPQQESQLRGELLELTQRVEQRIARALTPGRLSGRDRRVVEDAQSFLARSRKAFEEGDLPRALTLARKAYLLVSVLEKQS